MHYDFNYVSNVRKFFDLADSIMRDKLGFKRIATGLKPTDTSYYRYKKSLRDYNLEITYTIVDYNDTNKIKECMIEMTFIPLLQDKNGGSTDKGSTYTITGFKIIGAKDDNLIIEPFGDEQKIVQKNIQTNEEITNNFGELNKSKKYLLPLEKQRIQSILSGEISMEEYEEIEVIKTKSDNKSLCGLGCINGDEKSYCGCCYWQ